MIFLGKKVVNYSEPFIVAEISGNHCGHLHKALELIKAAKFAGADAVKIQCYDADDLTIPNGYVIGEGTPWENETLYELYQKAGTPKDWIGPLFKCAEKVGIPIFSSVYSKSGLETLERVNCQAYKIASYEANDTEFIREVVKTGKPVVVSVGTLSEEEIQRLYNILPRDSSILLHCVSKYPIGLDELYLDSMNELIIDGRYNIGFSCHSDNPIALSLASCYGAALIEVHLALDEEDNPPDYEFSFLPDGLKWAIEQSKLACEADTYKPPEAEQSAHKLRRSLYVVQDVEEGEPFTKENVKSFRPNKGCSPHLLPNIIGRKSNCHIAKYTPMKMEYVE